MNKDQYRSKLATYLLITSGATLLAGNSFANAEKPKTHPATAIDRVEASAKHKVLTEKTQSITDGAAEIETDTEIAIVALGNNDSKGAIVILSGVLKKLDTLFAKNPGLDLVTAKVEHDVFDFSGTNKEVANAINQAEDLLKHGKLQGARQIMASMASEIRVITTSIPLGTYATAIKQIIPLIESGKIDQASSDLNSLLETLVMKVEVTPLPLIRAEELLTLAANLEHRDDLSKEANRNEIQKFTDKAKDQLELAQLLGYGNKEEYKSLYKEIDDIQKTLFSEKSAAAWQRVKDKLAEFKNELNELTSAKDKLRYSAQ